MTSLGRGRGWAYSQNKESVLRRPGSTSPNAFDCTNLMNEISQIESEEGLKQQVHDMQKLFRNMDKETMMNIMKTLYTRAMEDREFGKKLFELIADSTFAQIYDDNNCSVRSHVLRVLQVDFTRRLEIRKTNVQYFRNTVYMLFEAYHRMRIGDVRPIQAFEAPLLDYMNMLLETATVEDLGILVEQMTKVGKTLHESMSPNSMNTVLMNVRRALITQDLNSLSRAMLLYIFDLANHEYGPLPNDLQKFYSKQLGNKSFMLLENNTEESVKNNDAETMSPPPSSNNAVPRAIRGSGAGKIQKTQRKPRTNPPEPRHTGERKGWDHDDRFNKDYD